MKNMNVIVYKDTIKPHDDDDNLSLIRVSVKAFTDYYKKYYKRAFKSFYDFCNNYTADDTHGFYDFCLNRGYKVKIFEV